MTKRLIFLIPSEGKTPEQLTKQTWDALVHYRATQRGLTKCEVCGEYKGQAIFGSKKIGIKCICEGILCTSCGATKIRRPISNIYDEATDTFWHAPFFLRTCPACRKR